MPGTRVYECLDVITQDRMVGWTIGEPKAESDGHGGCGSRAIEPAGTFNSTKQFRRYLEELLSNATPPRKQID